MKHAGKDENGLATTRLHGIPGHRPGPAGLFPGAPRSRESVNSAHPNRKDAAVAPRVRLVRRSCDGSASARGSGSC